MKLTMERAPLLQALGRLTRIVERRSTIPILSNILISAKGDTATFVATDLDMEAQVQIKADIDTGGKLTIPATMLHDIVRKFPNGAQVCLEEKDKGAQLQVLSGRSRFKLQALPACDFPELAPADYKASFSLPAKTLVEMIDRVSFAISSEETRYYLNGIYLLSENVNADPIIRVVTTDGHRLAKFDVPRPDDCKAFAGIIVPRKACSEIGRLADQVHGDITIDICPTKIRATVDGVVITSKTIDGTFPDYIRVIPTQNNLHCRVDREKLMSAVDRVSTVSSERGHSVKLKFVKQELSLSVVNPDSGTAEETMEVDYNDDTDIAIGFNARYLLDILGVMKTDHCCIQLSDPGSPAIVVEQDGTPFLGLLMPMRV